MNCIPLVSLHWIVSRGPLPFTYECKGFKNKQDNHWISVQYYL